MILGTAASKQAAEHTQLFPDLAAIAWERARAAEACIFDSGSGGPCGPLFPLAVPRLHHILPVQLEVAGLVSFEELAFG